MERRSPSSERCAHRSKALAAQRLANHRQPAESERNTHHFRLALWQLWRLGGSPPHAESGAAGSGPAGAYFPASLSPSSRTSGRRRLSVARPMPLTFIRSSMARSRPRRDRSARIAVARFSPMPGRRRKSSNPAELRTTGSSGDAGPREVAGAVVGDGESSTRKAGGDGAIGLAATGGAGGPPDAEGAAARAATGVVTDPATAARPIAARQARPIATRATRAAGFAKREADTRAAMRDKTPRSGRVMARLRPANRGERARILSKCHAASDLGRAHARR